MTTSPKKDPSMPQNPFDVGFDLESLRPPEYIDRQDPRSEMRTAKALDFCNAPSMEFGEYHSMVAEYTLGATVPKDVVIQFEVAKNLYLYAWFVYRFYPVSERQALACLELALRIKYEKSIREKLSKSNSWKPTLTPLLKFAIESGDMKNEGFRAWNSQVERRAQSRYENEIHREMQEKGLESVTYRLTDAAVTDEDRDWDYVGILAKTLPVFRNIYAHGCTTLHNQVLGTIGTVAEIINQIYKIA